MHKSFIRQGAAVVIVALMVLSIGSASAQTQGMDRLDDRRDDRTGAHEILVNRLRDRAARHQTGKQPRHHGEHGQQTARDGEDPKPEPANVIWRDGGRYGLLVVRRSDRFQIQREIARGARSIGRLFLQATLEDFREPRWKAGDGRRQRRLRLRWRESWW